MTETLNICSKIQIEMIGKRGWRVDKKDNTDRRTESNSIYRNHRLSEIEAESTTLMNVWRDVDIAEVDSKVLSRELARRLIT